MGAGKKAGIIFLSAVLIAVICFAYYVWRLNQWRGRYERGVALYEGKRYGEASVLLLSVCEDRPATERGRDAMFRYCRCLESLGKGDDAAERWQGIVADADAKKFHAAARMALARAAFSQGRFTEANKHLVKVIKDKPDSPIAGDAYFLLAGILEEKGDLPGAMLAAQKVIDDYPGSSEVGSAQKKLGALYIKLLFSRKIMPGTKEYVVQPGDSLDAIARRFNTTVELLKKMNARTIKGDSIRPNDRLKVCTEQYSILIDKSANTLTLKAGERVVKIYSVGTGKEGTTPVGNFMITNKIHEPEWFKPGEGVIPYGNPENLLGTRWMGIDSPGYGIHGTWEPETIGKQLSAGCVRLLNRDVEDLYTIVPAGTKVTIIE